MIVYFVINFKECMLTCGDIFTEAQSAEVNMPPRWYIEAMDRPTLLYILYTMVSAQQTNLLPKNASRNDAIFAHKVPYGRKFWREDILADC